MRRSLLSCASAGVATPRASTTAATNLSEHFMTASLEIPGPCHAARAGKLTPRRRRMLASGRAVADDLVERDRKIANAPAGRVIDGVANRRRSAGDADLACTFG